MILTIFLMLASALVIPQPADSVQSVELTLQTRGVYRSILVTPRTTRVDVNGKQHQQPTKPSQWKAILKALEGLPLADPPSLPTDVSRSAVDAALSARVRVTTPSQTVESVTYDHPNPPSRMAPLVKAIIATLPAANREAFQ
jgi:hypothetical protein